MQALAHWWFWVAVVIAAGIAIVLEAAGYASDGLGFAAFLAFVAGAAFGRFTR